MPEITSRRIPTHQATAPEAPLITVWLEDRVLPAPPPSPVRTGVSWSLTNCRQFAGVSAVQIPGVRSLPRMKTAQRWFGAFRLWRPKSVSRSAGKERLETGFACDRDRFACKRLERNWSGMWSRRGRRDCDNKQQEKRASSVRRVKRTAGLRTWKAEKPDLTGPLSWGIAETGDPKPRRQATLDARLAPIGGAKGRR